MNLLKSQKFNNKKVIIRVDLNVPLNEKNEVTDYTRIEAIKETVNFVIDNGGSCILLSHLGRPKEKDESLSFRWHSCLAGHCARVALGDSTDRQLGHLLAGA